MEWLGQRVSAFLFVIVIAKLILLEALPTHIPTTNVFPHTFPSALKKMITANLIGEK